MTPFNPNASKETDWAAAGERLSQALGVVARERVDLHGDAAYGEAVRMLVEAGHLVTIADHCAAVARSDQIAEGNRLLIEMAERQRLAAVSELRRTVDRQVADRMAGLADEVRGKAEREKLGHHVRRGVLLAADWLAARAASLASAEDQRESAS